MKKSLLLAMFGLASAGLFAHAGHDHEAGVFDPPHGGAFAKMAGQNRSTLAFCLFWPRYIDSNNREIRMNRHISLCHSLLRKSIGSWHGLCFQRASLRILRKE